MSRIDRIYLGSPQGSGPRSSIKRSRSIPTPMFPSPLTNPWLRLAARVSIVVIASLAAAAIVAQSAAASRSLLQAPGLTPSAIFEEEEAEAESEAEDWEEDEWEEEEEAEPFPGDECPLRSVRAHASTKHDKLKLTIGYTTNEPVTTTIQLRKGTVGVETFKRHLGKSGVLRFTEELGKGSGKLSVHFKLPSGSAGCPSRRLVLFPR
ncbi:MAG TPA: hypothetical protein VF255_00905 [Solirubrobacterales bacterium]